MIHLFDLPKGEEMFDIYVNLNESEVVKHYFPGNDYREILCESREKLEEINHIFFNVISFYFWSGLYKKRD